MSESYAQLSARLIHDAMTVKDERISFLEDGECALRIEIRKHEHINRSAREDLNLCRNHLRHALEALNQARCEECQGTGGVEIFDGPTPMDEVVVGFTDPKYESCPDCAGTGRELK